MTCELEYPDLLTPTEINHKEKPMNGSCAIFPQRNMVACLAQTQTRKENKEWSTSRKQTHERTCFGQTTPSEKENQDTTENNEAKTKSGVGEQNQAGKSDLASALASDGTVLKSSSEGNEAAR
jgi:hypothetical protein